MPALLLVLAALLVGSSCSTSGEDVASGKTTASGGTASQDEDAKTVYAMGRLLAKQFQDLGLDEDERKAFLRGFEEGLDGKGEPVKPEEYVPRIQALTQSRLAVLSTKEKEKGDAFLQKALAEPGAVRLPNGMVLQQTQAGTGAAPTRGDRVRVQYKGTTVDGEEFDSSYQRGRPAEFVLGQVIPCWSEGLTRLKVGAKAKLVCPASTAYGDQPPPQGPIKPGQTLVFEVELLDVLPARSGGAPGTPGGAPGTAPD